MRKILIILFGILTIYACSKDSLSIEEKEEDTFNSLIGKWQLQRASDTPDFETEYHGIDEFHKQNYIEITSDSMFICNCKWDENEFESSYGKFNIKFYEDKPYMTIADGICFDITKAWSFCGIDLNIYSLNKNTLILHPVYRNYEEPYIEYKRIK